MKLETDDLDRQAHDEHRRERDREREPRRFRGPVRDRFHHAGIIQPPTTKKPGGTP